ncbi:hypothetical protein LXL04_031647 [Taraxacum kok-saghyz]
MNRYCAVVKEKRLCVEWWQRSGAPVQHNVEVPAKNENPKSKNPGKRKNVKQDHISPTKPKRKKVLEANEQERRSKHKEDEQMNKKEKVQKRKKSKEDVNEEEGKKPTKEYPPGTRRLPTRMTPGRMTEAVKSLSIVQRECLIKMGFESFLKLDIADVPTKLLYHLVDTYDPGTNCLILNNGYIEINKQLIHDIFGLPNVGTLIGNLDTCADDHKTVQLWKAQYKNDRNRYTYSGKAYLKAIQSSVNDDVLFQLNFLMLFLNTFCESNLGGLTQVGLLEKLVIVDNYATVDWCAYMQECLVNRKQYWRRDDMTCYYTGPSTLLLLVYAYGTTSTFVSFIKKTPFIHYVSNSKLAMLEENEEKAGKFGVAVVARLTDHDDEDDDDLLCLQRNFGDVEAYCAIIELGYTKIMNERKNIEKALEAGMKQFPNNEELHEWKSKIEVLFKTKSSEDQAENDEAEDEEPVDRKGKGKAEDYTSPMHLNTAGTIHLFRLSTQNGYTLVDNSKNFNCIHTSTLIIVQVLETHS